MNLIKNIRRNKLLNTFSIYTFGRICSVLSSLLLIPLFTKKIPQAEFGIIGLLWLLNPLLSRIINLGTDVAVTLKFFKLNYKDFSNYVYHSMLIIFIMSLIIGSIFLINIQWVHLILDDSMNRCLFLLFFISIVSITIVTMMKSFLQYSGKAKENVLMTILPPIIVAIITYILILRVKHSYSSYVLGMAIGNSIFGVVAIVCILKKYSIKHFSFSLKITRNLLRVGVPILPGTIAGLILASGDRYVIKYFIGLEAVAIYVFGYRFAEYILRSIFEPFIKALSPILMEKSAADFKEAKVYSINVISFTILIFPLILAVIIIPFKNIMFFFGGEKYSVSFIIFLISLFGIIFYNARQVIFILFNYLERTELNMMVIIAASFVNIGLNILFVPKYGIIAAAFTTIVAYIMMFLLSAILINRFVHINLGSLKIMIKLIPFGLFIITIYLIDVRVVIPRVLISYVIKIAIFLIFFLCIYIIYPGTKEIINRCRSILR